MSGHTENPDEKTRRRLVLWLMAQGWTGKHTETD